MIKRSLLFGLIAIFILFVSGCNSDESFDPDTYTMPTIYEVETYEIEVEETSIEDLKFVSGSGDWSKTV